MGPNPPFGLPQALEAKRRAKGEVGAKTHHFGDASAAEVVQVYS